MPGRGNELKGSLKRMAGKALGNKQLQAEGAADKAAGKAARETAGAGNQLGGRLQRAVGRKIGNEQMQAEGEAKRLKGQAQSAG
jgi:uncharacterized protein YjbJ (UPF0337 family)